MTDPEDPTSTGSEPSVAGDPGYDEALNDSIQVEVERKRNRVGEAMIATGAGGFLYLVVFLFVMVEFDLSDAWARPLFLPAPLAFVACAILRIWKRNLDIDATVGPIQRDIKATIARLDVDIAELDHKGRRAREHPADPDTNE